MSDYGDMWREHREYKQREKWEIYHKVQPEKKLDAAGIKYEVKNKGYHLVIKDLYKTIDFWPTTGVWIVRNDTYKNGCGELENKRGDGVKALIQYILESREVIKRFGVSNERSI
jgi:hypothetical protein